MSNQKAKEELEEIKRGILEERAFDNVGFETWLTSRNKADGKEKENGIIGDRKLRIYKLSPSKRKLSNGGSTDENLLLPKNRKSKIKVPKLKERNSSITSIKKIDCEDLDQQEAIQQEKNELTSEDAMPLIANDNEEPLAVTDREFKTIDHNETNDEYLEDSFDEDITTAVKEEMETFIETFPTLGARYKLINKIGEGTFSTVYKAKPLFNLTMPRVPKLNDSLHGNENIREIRELQRHVALKRIYVTSSPTRIFNELALLNTLINSPNVAPLLDALRYEDQVVAVLPFYEHADFRDFYRDLPLAGIKFYIYELFKGIQFVHSKGIIHRDIKPTNFLYNPFTRKGVLVDFGLAEKEVGPDPQSNCCPCVYGGYNTHGKQSNQGLPINAYLKDDQRPGRRANRAGTRGFRAPEVLLKCNNQSVKLDIWSAGVMLMTLLGRRFPFFNSTDDVEALMEITTIFGVNEMKKCAKLHGLGFECTSAKGDGHSIGELLLFCVSTDAKEGDTFAPDSPAWELLQALDKKGVPLDTQLGNEYKEAIELLTACLKLDFNERITASNALKMDFFKEIRCKKKPELH